MKKTTGLVEQHIHGAFGYDFMNCSVDELIEVAKMLLQFGVTAFFPTIMTDNLDVIKNRINVVKQAMQLQTKEMAKIIGVHLEGPFINPDKAGIHEKKYILPLNVELYKQIEDDIIKIVTIAPELDKTGEFIEYLKSKNVKVSCGHSLAVNLDSVNQVTHLYNAMGTFNHREPSTVLSALSSNVVTEIIADSMHINDDVLKLTFKQKPIDEIILISDALPLAHSDKKEVEFAGQKIFNDNGKLVNGDGTFAGSSMLLCDIVKNLIDKRIIKFEDAIQCASSNLLNYHNISNTLNVFWNDLNKIEKIEII